MTKRLGIAIVVIIAFALASWVTRPWSPHIPTVAWYISNGAMVVYMAAWVMGKFD